MKILSRKANPLVIVVTIMIASITIVYFASRSGAQQTLGSLRIETDKDQYLVGENVTITVYFNNDETTEIIVNSTSYVLEISGTAFVFGMESWEMRNATLAIPPETELMIDSYIWDQKDFNLVQVPTGMYIIRISLCDYTLEGEVAIQIG